MLAERYIPRYTIEDYKHWRGDWELIEGIPFAMIPSPFGKHQKILGNIITVFNVEKVKCKENKYNVYVELDWIVDEETVVRPDITVSCEEIETHLKSPPRVIFEVISKSTAIKDEEIKFYLYEKEKVEYYILVYPDIEKVRGFKLKNDKYDKFFDDEKGILNINICGCSVKIDVAKFFV